MKTELSHKVSRRFHPIGQGAFYSEVHDGFNIVYDCGSTQRSRHKKLIENSFPKGAIIDILFISHFDSDHVNYVKELQKHFTVKKVVLPLLSVEENTLLRGFAFALGKNSFFAMLSNPSEFFGGAQIVEADPGDGINELGDNQEIINLEKVSGKLKSGTIIKSGDWQFIPYNYKQEDRAKQLIHKINKSRLSLKSIRENLTYCIDNRAELKKIYNSLNGAINQNSKMLYSGPSKVTTKNWFLCSRCQTTVLHRSLFQKVGCIYTGDGDLKLSDIETVYSDVWDKVGTIQIPHHGALNCFKMNILNRGEYIFSVSYGKSNKHGHPSSYLISEMVANNSKPIEITEDQNSLYLQVIRSYS